MKSSAHEPSIIRSEHVMKFGPQVLTHGVRFRLWAPKLASVDLLIHELDLRLPMSTLPRGWFELTVGEAEAGMHYQFVLPDGRRIADPVSRFLPDDVDGASRIIDPLSFAWSDRGWRGRPWHETVFYELHIGTFTQEGSFRAAINRLDHLLDLGVNTIEIMPVGAFSGRWNWGYDGASLFAPEASYGTPDDFKALIDAAHAKGISVVLDVVYNHFGPKGNTLPALAQIYSEGTETPWGPALDFEAEASNTTREITIANALYWLEEFHLDGLRFDAVHEIYDESDRHILQELAELARAATDGRHVHLIAENSLNHSNWLKRRENGQPWLYDAQWSDDFHHALHALITNEECWYYADFANRTDLAGRALAEGIAWQGGYLQHEQRYKGEPVGSLPPTAFVSFIQNHDQVGNRPHGNRISTMVSPEALRLLSAIGLLSPEIPLLFMGEEWATSSPFLFFSDVGDDLADAIRESRRDELSRYKGVDKDSLPDPMNETSFVSSKLNWTELGSGDHAAMFDHYRRLIAVRKAEIIPRLEGMAGHSGRFRVLGDRLLEVEWRLGDDARLALVANLGSQPADLELPADRRTIWLQGEVEGGRIGAFSCLFTLDR